MDKDGEPAQQWSHRDSGQGLPWHREYGTGEYLVAKRGGHHGASAGHPGGTQGIAAGATISGVIAYLPDSSQAPDFTLTSRVLADVPTATDVSAQTTIVRSGIIYDRAALTAQGRITITNNTSGVMNGPLTLVLTNLPAGVTLPNSFFIPGVGYVYPLPSPMAPGESIALTLLFHVDSIRPVNYTATVFSGNP